MTLYYLHHLRSCAADSPSGGATCSGSSACGREYTYDGRYEVKPPVYLSSDLDILDPDTFLRSNERCNGNFDGDDALIGLCEQGVEPIETPVGSSQPDLALLVLQTSKLRLQCHQALRFCSALVLTVAVPWLIISFISAAHGSVGVPVTARLALCVFPVTISFCLYRKGSRHVNIYQLDFFTKCGINKACTES